MVNASERVVDCRNDYLWLADLAKIRRCQIIPCRVCQQYHLDVDAASISLDLAVAIASEERTRKSVAW